MFTHLNLAHLMCILCHCENAVYQSSYMFICVCVCFECERGIGMPYCNLVLSEIFLILHVKQVNLFANSQ